MTNESKLVPLALLRNIELTWREASAFSNTANQLIETGLPELRDLLAAPVVERHEHFAELDLALVLECERAIKQRDEFLRTGIVTAGHGGSHDTCFGAILRQHLPNIIATAPPQLAELQALSVTNIMLDVVPGDGSGHEVYAKSVSDVEAMLSKMCEQNEELQVTTKRQAALITSLRSELAESYRTDLSELRAYHAKAVENLKSYADDSGLRESDVKHYRKRAEFHENMVTLIDATAALNDKGNSDEA